MKPYRLQSVLNYRKRLENMAHKSLLTCMEEEMSLNLEKQKLQKEVLRLCEELRKTEQKGIFLPEMMLYETCIQTKKRHLNEIGCKLDELVSEIIKKQDELVMARQDKRALEILKEKKEEEEKRKQRQTEKKNADDTAIRVFGERK